VPLIFRHVAECFPVVLVNPGGAAGEPGESALDLTYAALASPTRRAILTALRDAEIRVTDLARQFPATLATISKHVQVLERADLVHREIRGRDHYLTAQPDNLAQAERWIAEYTSFWEASADALARHLEEGRQAHPREHVRGAAAGQTAVAGAREPG
jgi:DNA-binding transcriptional ArsR family regulator